MDKLVLKVYSKVSITFFEVIISVFEKWMQVLI